MRPYPTIDIQHSLNKSVPIEFSLMLEEYQIYDAHSGVNIVDFGIGEKEWNNSMWGIMGFSYNQFNPNSSDLQNINGRISDSTINVSGATTEASIISSDSLNYPVNIFGTQLYNTNILSESNVSGTDYFPPTTVLATSTVISARDLPRKILRGYFLIESDILSDANYYLTSNPLQVIAVCDKYNAQSDFVNYDGSAGVQFTVTKKKNLTDIKTQIKDPDGSLAQVGDNSGIIYKVTKQIKADLNFATNLMSGMYGKPPQ